MDARDHRKADELLTLRSSVHSLGVTIGAARRKKEKMGIFVEEEFQSMHLFDPQLYQLVEEVPSINIQKEFRAEGYASGEVSSGS